MKRRMYQIRDVVAGCLIGGSIVLERNDAPAVRAFFANLESDKSPLSENPKDYELLYLGEYDDEVGVVETGFLVIATGVEWYHRKERERAVELSA